MGKLIRQYYLLEKLTFTSATEQKVLLVCSCAGGKEQHDRLAVTSSEICIREHQRIHQPQTGSALYCIHAKTALKLASEEFDPNSVPEYDDEESSVDLLSTSPFLAVHGIQQFIWLNFKANCWEHNQIHVQPVHLCEVCTYHNLPGVVHYTRPH